MACDRRDDQKEAGEDKKRRKAARRRVEVFQHGGSLVHCLIGKQLLSARTQYIPRCPIIALI